MFHVQLSKGQHKQTIAAPICFHRQEGVYFPTLAFCQWRNLPFSLRLSAVVAAAPKRLTGFAPSLLTITHYVNSRASAVQEQQSASRLEPTLLAWLGMKTLLMLRTLIIRLSNCVVRFLWLGQVVSDDVSSKTKHMFIFLALVICCNGPAFYGNRPLVNPVPTVPGFGDGDCDGL